MHLQMGDLVMFVASPGEKEAGRALSALAQAMEAQKVVAIVRYVWRAKASPKIGVLFPVKEE